jgi:predicted aldo/keto reductase-like oxidoreductase
MDMKMKKKFGRREFLKSSVLGASGVMTGGVVVSQAKILKEEVDSDKVIYRTLGRTGIKLPIVSMGVMRAETPNLVKAALKKGIVLLDTAHVYQGGRNEEMLGKILKDYPRDSFILATKIKGEGMNSVSDEEAERLLMEKFETSMKRLQLDYVDILYLHNSKSVEYTLYKPFTNVLKKLKAQGRTRFIGVSTHSHEPEIINAATDSGFYDVVLTAINFTQDHNDEILKAARRASEKGLGVIAMKTMAGGYLDKDRKKKVNAKAALKWVMQNDFFTTSIPGFTSFDQLDDSWSIMANLKLTKEELGDLNLSYNHGSMYCNGCEQCVAQCPKQLPIPDAMRAYMYAFGYQATAKAKNLLTRLNIHADACSDCDQCTVQCIKGFDVRGKIAAIQELKNIPDAFLT